MAGTSEGGKKSAAKLTAKDPDYYRKLAQRVRSRGRSANHPAVFEAGTDRPRVEGAKGGKAAARARRASEEAEAPGDSEATAVRTAESAAPNVQQKGTVAGGAGGSGRPADAAERGDQA